MKNILSVAAVVGMAFAAALFGAETQPTSAPTSSTSLPSTTPLSGFYEWAQTPPMGWNSWDCFGAGVTEQQTLDNAEYMDKHLKAHGWNIVTVDIQWYEPLAHTDAYRRNAVLEMDANGRLLPAGNRFPLTAGTHSFKALADVLHAKGLKFGLHLLRGIPRQAVAQNVAILGTEVHATDIADTKSVCRWNGDMYGVDMSKAGAQEYYDSVFALMASWDLDLVKVDDLSAPYHKAEIEGIRKAIDKCGRRIIFSTSPGATPVNEGPSIEANANMWRISDDFWDSWPALYSQFARLESWTPYRGAGHFPDADMIPFGNIRAWRETDSWTHFTHDEQMTLMTLWSIARSPLILGANLPKNDEFTLSLLTNDAVIAVNQHSGNNHQVFRRDNQIAWVADVEGSADKYVAVFYVGAAPAGGRGRGAASQAAVASAGSVNVKVALADIGMPARCDVQDLWSGKDLGVMTDEISTNLALHRAALYRVSGVR